MSDFTDKQTAFIRAYLGDAHFNALEAARQAGYAHPVSSASDLMRPGYKVREEINRRLEERLPSDSELLDEMLRIALADTGDHWVKASDKRQAIKDIFEIRGRLIQKHEHRMEGNVAAQIASILGVQGQGGGSGDDG